MPEMDGDVIELSRGAALFIALIVPCVGSAVTCLLVLQELSEGWVKKIRFPDWDPLSIRMHLVMWSLVSICLGLASFIAWDEGGGFYGDAKYGLILHAVTLITSWCYTPIFFESHNILMAYYVSLIMMTSSILEAYFFFRISLLALALSAPYALYMTVAFLSTNSTVALNLKTP